LKRNPNDVYISKFIGSVHQLLRPHSVSAQSCKNTVSLSAVSQDFTELRSQLGLRTSLSQSRLGLGITLSQSWDPLSWSWFGLKKVSTPSLPFCGVMNVNIGALPVSIS
jgi:hypothetical protein